MRNLFITGGAGYLGRALLRELAKTAPATPCTIFSRDHGKHSFCQREFPQHRYVIGDVRDYDSVQMAMAGHDIVIHAAAFKYVPEGEVNVAECHEINVMGSLNVARAAIRNNVSRVVGISTDKACQPINVYGITKLMMERLFQEADAKSPTQFNVVRYGNVVSSTGSAIPLFRRQARENKRVKITNPEMTRFWLTVEQGVELIMMALQENSGGTVLIPRLPSLNMMDVAKATASIEYDGMLKGIVFETIGPRFGEKMHEELLSETESIYADGRGYTEPFKVMGLTPTWINNAHPYHRYTSEYPDRKLSIEEAINMIKSVKE